MYSGQHIKEWYAMNKRIYILSLLISYVFITSTSCAKQNNKKANGKKEYNLVLILNKTHNIRYDLQDVNEKLVLNEDEGEEISENLYIVTNDSVYVALNISNYESEFPLYSIQEIDNLSLFIKYRYNTERDSLLLKLDEENNILDINDNKYYINKSYTDLLKKEGFGNKSILPFIAFINPNIDDFFSFHDLTTYRWIENPSVRNSKILKSDIKVKHPLNEDIIFDFSVDYIYRENDLLEIVKYDKDRDTVYHKKHVESTDYYDLYESNYNDILGRSYEESTIYINKDNINDSISSSTTSVQRGQVDESRSKIIFHKEYPIKKLNLSKTEIESLISKDSIILKNN